MPRNLPPEVPDGSSITADRSLCVNHSETSNAQLVIFNAFYSFFFYFKVLARVLCQTHRGFVITFQHFCSVSHHIVLYLSVSTPTFG